MDREELKYKYFSEGLSESEGLLFDQYLAEDDAFYESFIFEKQRHSRIEQGKQAIKEPLKSLGKEVESLNKTQPSRYHNLFMTAGIVLFFSVGWLLYSFLFGIDVDELYTEYFEAYPNVFQSSKHGEELEGDLASESLGYYELGDYKTASESLIELMHETSDPYVVFYLSQCYLSLNKFQDAKFLLSALVKEKKGFYSESLWYLSLTELKLNNIKETNALLNTLIKEGNYKVAQGKELLKLLD